MAGQKFRVRDGLDCGKFDGTNYISQDIVNAVWAGDAIAINKGGTGTTTTPADGKLLIGKTNNTYAVANLSAGSGISITNGDGTITIAANNSGTVTSVTASSPLASTGGATPDISLTGTVPVANGGTGTATGSITGTGALTFTAGSTNTNINLVPNGTGTVDVASKKITSVADPTISSDAANKSYVDSVAQGLDVKGSVKYASTGNLGLSGTSVTNINVPAAVSSLTVGDRILVKDQSTGSQNGIYVVASGSWTRATDMAASSDASGAFTFVQYGSSGTGSLADTGWVQTADPAVVGTDALVWTQFSGAGTYSAGNGLTLTGSSFAIDTNITVDKTTSQTLTNKTLTTPIISSISNSGTLTLPTTTDTLVGRATTDTLTNKTLTSPIIDTSASATYSGSTVANTVAINTTLSTTSATSIATVTARSACFMIQATQSTNYLTATVQAIHDGTTVTWTQFGTLFTNTEIATFDCTVSSGVITLRATAGSATSCTYRVVATGLVA
jgi:hypothetical protein